MTGSRAMAENPSPRRQAKIITFYSYKGGVGRTMALANVAWILASAGRRVLVVDWDLDSPGLHQYFSPFLKDKNQVENRGVVDLLHDFMEEVARAGPTRPPARPDLAELDGLVQSVSWPHFSTGGAIDLFGPGKQNAAYTIRVSTIPWAYFVVEQQGVGFVNLLREWFRDSGYDYVLLDSRTGNSDVTGICTCQLPDTVALCFTLNNQAIEGATRLTETIAREAPGTTVVPVPTRVEYGELDRLERRRQFAQRRLAPALVGVAGERPLDQLAYLARLEVPHRARYAYEEVLAPFAEPLGVPSGLLSAYERLTEALTDGAVTSIAPIPLSLRRKVVEDFERRAEASPRSAVVLAAAEERAWREWIAAELAAAGVSVEFDPLSRTLVDVAVVVVSPNLRADSPGDEAVRERLSLIGKDADDPSVVGVRVVEGHSGTDYERHSSLSLAARNEESARKALHDRLGTVASAGSGPAKIRYPGNRPKIHNILPANPWFVGRVSQLDEIRDALAPGGAAPGLYAIIGPGGIGKTALVREFCHRFDSDYDVIWWVDASEIASLRSGLVTLGRHVLPRAPTDLISPDINDVAAVLGALGRGEPFGRWLLVLDNATAPEAVDGLLPATSAFGHVIVISREGAWGTFPDLRLGRLERGESLLYLGRRLPNVSPAVVEELARESRDFPLDLVHAAGWVAGSDQTAADAVRDFLARRRELPSSEAGSSSWHLAFTALRTAPDPRRRAAARMLELCSFLSPNGVSTKLLGSASFLRRLAEHVEAPALADPVELPAVLQVIQQFSLADVTSTPDGELRMHRITRELTRSSLSPDQQGELRREVLDILVGYAPDADVAAAPASWPAFAELQTHLVASGALDSDDQAVRTWLVYQTFYLWKTGRWIEAVEIGGYCLARWRNSADIGPSDPTTLRIAGQVASVYRSSGRIAEAFELDEDTLSRQRRTLGLDHPNTLTTASGLGADKRALGWYRDAFAEDQSTVAGFRRNFGDEHPATMNAEHNLALSLFFNGDLRASLQLNWDVYEKRRRILGPDHPSTLWSQGRIAVCRREIGEYDEARRMLTNCSDGLASAEKYHSHNYLRTRRNLAVSLRLLGDGAIARSITDETLAEFRSKYGPSDAGSLSCQLSLAADLHMLGDTEKARDLARECLEGYVRRYGEDHPVTHACRTNLSVYLRALGDRRSGADIAREAHEALDQVLLSDHPHTLAAANNLANALAATAEEDEAREIYRQALDEARHTLGIDHRYTAALRANLGTLTRKVGVAGGAELADLEIDVPTII